MSSIPGNVGYIYTMFIEPTITWVPSGFSRYIWLDTKIVLKKFSFDEIIDRETKLQRILLPLGDSVLSNNNVIY